MNHDPERDPAADLAVILRASAERRIAEQVAAAARRREAQQQTRAEFTASRTAGVRRRNSAREARLRMIANHQQAEEAP
ncbi:hypothetical protein [Streptacidiphilus carbonis]|uniref:hypothetical protein n=1 Tax=Streptacidiphilus carbonis TaxID=105422 RepID=UPI0005A96A6E|nr:hypothetical protein [Streptacidiphilus carbonis]